MDPITDWAEPTSREVPDPKWWTMFFFLPGPVQPTTFFTVMWIALCLCAHALQRSRAAYKWGPRSHSCACKGKRERPRRHLFVLPLLASLPPPPHADRSPQPPAARDPRRRFLLYQLAVRPEHPVPSVPHSVLVRAAVWLSCFPSSSVGRYVLLCFELSCLLSPTPRWLGIYVNLKVVGILLND